MLNPGNTLLFIGDSITHAHRRPEELHDCYYLGCGYVNRVAGVLGAEHPQLQLRFINRGECGHTVNDLEGRWERDCLAHGPDLVSILIGINDAGCGAKGQQTVAEYADAYRRILSALRQRLPKVRLVMLEPFALRLTRQPGSPLNVVSSEQLEQVPSRQQVARELAGAFGAVFVPLQQAFDDGAKLAPASHWTLDGIHPSAAGHQLIARQWLAATRSAGVLPA